MHVYASRLKLRERLGTGLWFVPTTMVLGSALLAALAVAFDTEVIGNTDRLPALLDVSPGSARAVLSVVAGSMIGTMGTVLAMTVITLSLASTQFTPRALANFTRDRGTQTVIGTFTGTFTYCLLVLRTVRDGAEQGGVFVPAVAVALAIVLGLLGVAALIYFTHNVATSINVATVVSRLATKTAPLLDTVFPEGVGTALDEPPAELATLVWRPVASHGTGYVQVIDGARLIELARERNVVVCVERAIGSFVVEGDALLSVADADDRGAGGGGGGGGGGGSEDDFALALIDCIALGEQRTLQQDPEYGVRQVADIAVRTLSTGTNDPTTALLCLDYLTVLLRRVAARPDPVPHRADAAGRLRLVAQPPTFETVALRTLDHVRQNMAGDAAAIHRLLQGLAEVAHAARDDERRRTVWEHAARVGSVADRNLTVAADRQRVNEALQAVATAARVGTVPADVLLEPEAPAAA